jgi:hypothetical protein
MSIFGNAVGAAMNHLMKISGGTLTGDLNMDGHGLTGLKNPAAPTQAANKQYVDTAVKPKAEKFTFFLALFAGRWVGSQPPYTQTVSLEGILATDCPHFGLIYSGTPAVRLAQKESFAMVDDLDTGDGSITFTCLEEKPGVDLTLQLEVVR